MYVDVGLDPCKWPGVGCRTISNNTETVISINFTSYSMKGNWPSTSSILINLEQLIVSNNYITGNIPDIFGNMVNLTTLSFADNGNYNDMPSSIMKCKQLQYLDLSLESVTLDDIEWDSFPNLRYLNLSSTYQYRSWPPSLSSVSSLVTLDLSDNVYYDNIPDDAWTGLTNLEHLNLQHAGFTGKVPSSLQYMTRLKYLNLGDNGFLRPIPDLSALTKLEALNLNGLSFIGDLPPQYYQLPMKSL